MLDRSQLTPINNISPDEWYKFEGLAHAWRDDNGPFRRVLAFNRCRAACINDLIDHHQDDAHLEILDIGCGAGILTEAVAGTNRQVTGIDVSGHNIEVARFHAQQRNHNLHYRHCLAHTLLEEPTRFDVVLNTEVVEHVPDPAQLIRQSAQLVKPGGLLIIATLNRTWLSYLVAIIGAEYLLKALPKGTHDWHHFVTPEEVAVAASSVGCTPITALGMAMNPVNGRWRITNSTAVNYLSVFRKNGG